jgi:hypothetical protein
VPKSLKHLALRVVANDTSMRGAPIVANLRDEVALVTAPDWTWFDRKDRNCPELAGKIKYGEFGRFPKAQTEYLPQMFSVDLVAAARNTLLFLTMTRNARALWEKDLAATCKKRYVLFMKLQAKHLDLRLLPPPDVAVVHFSHMLQSKEYQVFAQSFGKGLEKLPHCSDWMFEGADGIRKAAIVTEKFWSKSYLTARYETRECSWAAFQKAYEPAAIDLAPTGNSLRRGEKQRPCGRQARDTRMQACGDLKGGKKTIPLDEIHMRQKEVPVVESETTLAALVPVVLLDQDWLHNFAAAANGRLKFDDKELETMHVDYQRYLFLTCKYEYKMEWIGFAPTPGIDLMWHSHLLRPAAYFGDVFELCGCVPHHKLLPEDARVAFVYQAHESEAAKLWNEEFLEELRPLCELTIRAPAPKK